MLIVFRSKESLTDTSLEPRDCYELWRAMTKHGDTSRPPGQELDPNSVLPEMIKKSDVIQWESSLKDRLHEWMSTPDSPFDKVHEQFQASANPGHGLARTVLYTFPLLEDLRSRGALPAIIFNYDRSGCEMILQAVLGCLERAEQAYRDWDPEWKKKVKRHKLREAQKARTKAKTPKATNRRGDKEEGVALDKTERLRDESLEALPESDFDPDAPIAQFSFADTTKCTAQELEDMIASLEFAKIKRSILDGLRRGVGVHHAGMNRHYRQVYVPQNGWKKKEADLWVKSRDPLPKGILDCRHRNRHPGARYQHALQDSRIRRRLGLSHGTQLPSGFRSCWSTRL
jgi:ATP-dependent RNA helicase DDX60